MTQREQHRGELRQQLREGRYRPEAEEIAEAMIEHLEDDGVDEGVAGDGDGDDDPESSGLSLVSFE